jgi:cob(I)alamin adenosyltransferase
VVRRAERETAALAQTTPLNPLILQYLNRLSDHLFVLAHHLNGQGAEDVLWSPGGNR